MSVTDKEPSSFLVHEVITKDDASLVKVMKNLLKSCRRETEVLKTNFIPAARNRICVGKGQNKSCCAWNDREVMCCLVRDGKKAGCNTWKRDENCVCYRMKGKVYCVVEDNEL